jgi:hypothetical protein
LKSLFNESTVDAWISGLGSAVGALLAGIFTGLVAIYVMTRQIKAEQEKSQKDALDSFSKSRKLLWLYANKIYKAGEIVVQPMKESNSSREIQELHRIHEENIIFITSVYEDMISYKKIIEEIDSYTIYEEVFDTYLEIKMEVESILYYTNRFLYHNAQVISPLENSLEKLSINIKKFNTFTLESRY